MAAKRKSKKRARPRPLVVQAVSPPGDVEPVAEVATDVADHHARKAGAVAEIAIAVAVAAVTFAVFANAMGNAFVYDDVRLIKGNPMLRDAGHLKPFFGASYWANVTATSRLYRPLTVWSFAVDRALFGPGPGPVHTVNVLLNSLLAALTYLLLRRCCRGRFFAAVGALVFALHPVHTEVVANGVGRGELWATLLTVAAMLLHVLSCDGPPSWRRWGGWTAAAVAFGAALLFKESAVVFPALAALADVTVVCRGDWRRVRGRAAVYGMYVLVLMAYLGLRVSIIGAAPPPPPELLARATWLQQRLYGSETMLAYIGQLLAPIGLCADYRDYTRVIAPSLSSPLALLSLAAWGLWGGLAWRLCRRRQWDVFFGLAWFFVAILPVSNLVVTIGTPRADRLLFLPSMGWAMILAALLSRLDAAGRRRATAGVVTALVLLAYGWRSVVRNRDWRSNRALWEATVRDNPGCAIAWRNLADIRKADGDRERAREYLEKAIALRDGAGFFYPEAHIHLGHLLREAGQTEAAEREYRGVVERRPEHIVALISLAQVLAGRAAGREEAADLLARAVRLRPNYYHAHANLADVLCRLKRYDEALVAVDRALALKRDAAYIWQIKARILAQLGRRREAREAVRQAGGLQGARKKRTASRKGGDG